MTRSAQISGKGRVRRKGFESVAFASAAPSVFPAPVQGNPVHQRIAPPGAGKSVETFDKTPPSADGAVFTIHHTDRVGRGGFAGMMTTSNRRRNFP